MGGIDCAIGIIYKESYDKDFLQRFCKIGTVVDCNGILHSKAANDRGTRSVWGKWRCSIFPHYFFIRQSMGLIAL